MDGIKDTPSFHLLVRLKAQEAKAPTTEEAVDQMIQWAKDTNQPHLAAARIGWVSEIGKLVTYKILKYEAEDGRNVLRLRSKVEGQILPDNVMSAIQEEASKLCSMDVALSNLDDILANILKGKP